MCAYWNVLFVQEMLCACVRVDVPVWWCALLCAGLIWGQPTVTGKHVEILPIIPIYWIPGFPSSPLSHRQINISRIRVPLTFLMRSLQKVQHLLRLKTRTVPDLTLIHWHLSDVLEWDGGLGRSLLPLKGLFLKTPFQRHMCQTERNQLDMKPTPRWRSEPQRWSIRY